MASRRTKSIGTKVTPEEYTCIQTLAGEQPVSEWVRGALLKAADPPAGDATPKFDRHHCARKPPEKRCPFLAVVRQNPIAGHAD